MFPVGGKPIGRIIVETLRYYGFIDIIFCISKQWSKYIQDYFGDGRRFGVNIQYSESEKSLGTAGEVKNAQGLITDDFLIYYGDILTKINLRELYETHEIHKDNLIYAGTLSVQDKINSEVGIIKTNLDTITSFNEKEQLPYNSWSAIAILKRNVLDYIEMTPGLHTEHHINDEIIPCNGDCKSDFGLDVFPKIIKEGLILKSYINTANWFDVGNLKSYRKVNENEDYT